MTKRLIELTKQTTLNKIQTAIMKLERDHKGNLASFVDKINKLTIKDLEK